MRKDGRVPRLDSVRYSVRLRRLSVLSAAALSVLVLAGCTNADDTEATPEATADLCDAQVDSGAATDAVSVEGAVGESATASFDAPLEVDELQASVVTEGDGDAISEGDLIGFTLTAYDADSGEQLASLGYEPGEMLPSQISAETVLGQLFGCATTGSRIVAAFPASDTAAAEVYVMDLQEIVPTAAWGEAQEPVDGMPTVELAEDGTPTVTIPESDAPTETTIATLKQGDGYEVQEGDTPLIQYQGVKWSNGEVFDQTWDGGTPIAYPTTNYVEGFQKALVGQQVGSQVLVVIPPAEGYGEGEINEEDLTGETLVFVIDILGAQAAA